MIEGAELEKMDLEETYLHASSSYQAGKYKLALASFHILIGARPYNAHAWQGLAACYLMLGEYKNAHQAALVTHSIMPESDDVKLLLVEAAIMAETIMTGAELDDCNTLLKSIVASQITSHNNAIAKKREHLYFLLEQRHP